MISRYLLDRTSPSFRNAVDEIVKFIDTYFTSTETPALNILYELGYRLHKRGDIEASYITLSVRFSLADNSHPMELALSYRTSISDETEKGTIKFNHPLPNPNPANILERFELWGEHDGEKACKAFMGEAYSILRKLWSKVEEIKKINAMQILGKEGFLDTSKEPDYGINTQYESGLDNLADRSVYDDLIKAKKTKESNEFYLDEFPFFNDKHE